MARPIPPAAPVTTAVRFASLMILAIDRASCGLLLGRGTPERHRAVIHSAQPQRRQIERIVLVQPPRLPRPLLWEDGSCPLDIARGQADRGFLYDGRIATAWHAPHIPLRVQVVHKTVDVLCRELTLQRPRRVRVAEGNRQVWDIAEHHAL